MNLHRHMLLGIALVLWWLPLRADVEKESPVDVVTVGHWLQVRGEYRENSRFEARDVELVEPARYDELIGTVREADPDKGRFVLLGQSIEIQPKTSFARLDRRALEGQRVKVEGYFLNAREFSAREIAQRGEGLDRITGRVEEIRDSARGTEFRIMNFWVLVPPELEVEHFGNVEDYPISESRIQSIADRGKDEEDLYGRGIRVTDKLLFFSQIETESTREDNFDLDDRDAEDVDEALAAAKARIVYIPSDNFFAVLEANYRRLWREDDEDGRENIRNERIAEAYVYWLDPARIGLDFQLGRVDFDDEREWLYDQYLDGPRLIWFRENIRAELSLTTTLSDGSPVDEEADNTILYVSNNNEDRHLAAYVIHRDFDFPAPERRTHLGFRVIGEWLPRQKSWLEVATMRGETDARDAAGWGFDIGSTWEFHDHFALTGGYAMGTGDRSSTGTDETFRQTGMQDNNGKFAGVSSFRYYGEAVDPELANLEVLTIGFGWLPRRRVSLDLVGHKYRQHKLSRRWVDSQIDRNPNGISSDLGRELDVILGWRTDRRWDLEIIAAWYEPGDAFEGADGAFFGKFQFRYRF